MKQKSETNRVEAGGEGIGEVSEAMVVDRAREIALADGRDKPHDGDLEQARFELGAGGAAEPADPAEDIEEADRPGNGIPPVTTGSRAPRLEIDDEAGFEAAEVEEGIEEAEFDTRKKSRHVL